MGARQYVYDGRQLVAVLVEHDGCWRVLIHDQEIGVARDRVAALRLINTHAEDNRYGQTQVAAG